MKEGWFGRCEGRMVRLCGGWWERKRGLKRILGLSSGAESPGGDLRKLLSDDLSSIEQSFKSR